VLIGEQLALTLPWGSAMGEGSLTTTVESVIDAWTVGGALSAQTLDKFGLLARRFARFADAHDVTALADVDRALVTKFVAAKGRTRYGQVSDAAVATMHNRRAALRAFFRTARHLRLTLDDSTTDIAVPAREASSLRPLTDDEAALVRLFSQRSTPTRHAATTALLLAGAHTGELGHITTTDSTTAPARFGRTDRPSISPGCSCSMPGRCGCWPSAPPTCPTGCAHPPNRRCCAPARTAATRTNRPACASPSATSSPAQDYPKTPRSNPGR
jgi:hypothetical protein